MDLERRRADADSEPAAREHCWSADGARRVSDAAEGSAHRSWPRFAFLALGQQGRASRSLHGLTWADLDLDAGEAAFLFRHAGILLDDAAGAAPTLGPHEDQAHADDHARRPGRLAQLTPPASRRDSTQDAEPDRPTGTFGLMFAKEPEDLGRRGAASSGSRSTTLSEATVSRRSSKAAGVKRIKFHGVQAHGRDAVASRPGTPPHVVAARLGHSVMELMKTYAHALPGMQQQAAATRLGAGATRVGLLQGEAANKSS